MANLTTKVLVLGGGPGGYVAAIRAGQLGLETLLVEAGPLGGTCLNVGCIPSSKALIEAGHAYANANGGDARFGLSASATLDFGKTADWVSGIVGRLNSGVAGLLRKAGVQVLQGYGQIVDGKTVDVETPQGRIRVVTQHLVLATGSVPSPLAALPFGGNVLSSSDVVRLAEVPKSLAVVGGGYIGVELGAAFADLGSKVTIVEAADRILPAWDSKLTAPVAKALEANGVRLVLGAQATGLGQAGAGLVIEERDGSAQTIAADKILVAIGRRPNVEGYGLDDLGLDRDGRFVQVDARCATSMHNVWAVGDLTGEPMLAHRAMAQGRVVAEVIAGQKSAFDPAGIPAVCFSNPEIVAIGRLPDTGGESRLLTGTFPLVGNGRAMTLGADSGMVRVVADPDTRAIVGMQAVGPHVSEFASSFALAMEMGATLDDIAQTIHAHPTLGEAMGEAAFAALGHPMHI